LGLKSRGLTHAEMARLADVSPRSVQRSRDEFESEAFTQASDACLANLHTCPKHQLNTLLNLEFQLLDEDVPFLTA
jgi:hypothetical protein